MNILSIKHLTKADLVTWEAERRSEHVRKIANIEVEALVKRMQTQQLDHAA